MTRFLLSILIVSYSFCAPMIHWRGDYRKALHDAKKSGRTFLVLLVRSNCKDCSDLVQRIGENKELARRIEERSIAVIVTVDSRARYPIELYYTNEYPSLFLVDPSTETFLRPPCMGRGCLGDLATWYGF